MHSTVLSLRTKNRPSSPRPSEDGRGEGAEVRSAFVQVRGTFGAAPPRAKQCSGRWGGATQIEWEGRHSLGGDSLARRRESATHGLDSLLTQRDFIDAGRIKDHLDEAFNDRPRVGIGSGRQ